MKLEDLSNLNPWWKFGKDFWKYDRNLKVIKDAFIEFERRKILMKKGNIYILRGIRQSGKTTYLKQTILNLIQKDINPNSILYISCDHLVSRKELSNVIDNFIRMNRDIDILYIFLDEITYLDGWNLELKTLADSSVIDKLVIFATGSNPVKLKEKTERMPGRRVEGNEYYFKPLTFREFALNSIGNLIPFVPDEFGEGLKRLKEKLKDTSIDFEQDLESMLKCVNLISVFKEELDYLLDIYLLTGGFPAVINDYFDNKFVKNKEFIRGDFYETLLRIILGDLSKIGRSELMGRELMKGVLKRYTNKYSFTELGKDIETSHQTVIDYLEILENSFILQVLYSFDIPKKKIKFKGDKKIYFSDPFVYNAISSFIAGADGFSISKDIMFNNKDKLIEAVALNHLSQTKEFPYLKEWKTYLGFFYSVTGKEIDFIYQKNNGNMIGIEVKYREDAKRNFTKIGEVKEYIVVTKSQLDISADTLFIPASLFFALLEKSEKLI